MNVHETSRWVEPLLRGGRRLKQRLRSWHGGTRPIEGEMYRRITRRHRTFWTAPDAQEVVRSVLSAGDSLELWQRPQHWQRRLSNKGNAREFARLHGCRVPELYWRGGDAAALDWASLPKHYVIRPTFGHSCRGVYVMSNGVNLMDGKPYSPEQLRGAMAADAQANPGVEFLFEQFVRSETGEYGIQKDYKLFTFAGEIAGIQVIRRSGPSKGCSRYFDVNWKPLPQVGASYPAGPAEKPPGCFEQILQQARALSRSYAIFVRLDFYATDQGAVLGEFTPTPGGGRGFTPYGDQRMVEYWDRYCPGMI